MPHFGNYDAASFGWPRTKAGVVPFASHGVAFPQGVQARAVELFTLMLNELVPHIPGGLRAGECWGYTDKPLFHGAGIAIDVNAVQNPIHRDASHGPHTLPNDTGAIVRKYGMEWGGDWTNPVDYMHIELHLAPSEIPAWLASLRAKTPDKPAPPGPSAPPPFRTPRLLLAAYGRTG